MDMKFLNQKSILHKKKKRTNNPFAQLRFAPCLALQQQDLRETVNIQNIISWTCK